MSEVSMIRARGLGRRFGSFVAVEGVDLDVRRGEVFGFLGPNGAGKTTTMRMLSGLVAPSEGQAEIAGISVVDEPDRVRASIGILTESPGLYIRLDAVENLEFFAQLHGMKRARPRIESLLRRFGLWERRREPAGSYSKGMRQKLAIARAVLHEPKVVFLDEPTSALDPEAAQVVKGLVRELESEGAAVILCTHNLDEAERLCRRIAVIKQRVLVVEAPSALGGGSKSALRVEVARDAPRAKEIAAAVPGVREVVLEGEASDGASALRVVADEGRAVAPVLARALVEGGLDLVSIAEVRRRLEDVYLDLVRGEAPSAGEGQAAEARP